MSFKKLYFILNSLCLEVKNANPCNYVGYQGHDLIHLLKFVSIFDADSCLK